MKYAIKQFIVALLLFLPVLILSGLKEELEEKAVELVLFGETTIKGIKIVQEEDGNFKATLEEDRPVSILDIPGFSSLTIPDSLKQLISKATIENLVVETDGSFVGLSGKAIIFGKSGIPIKLRAIREGKKLVWAQWIELPADMTLARLISPLQGVNIGISDGALIFSSYVFNDSKWTGAITKGVTLVGKLIVPDVIAKQLKLSQKTIDVKGTVTRDWTGSKLIGTVDGKSIIFEIEGDSLVVSSGSVKVTVGNKKKIAIGASELELLPEGGFKAGIKAGQVSLADIPGITAIPMPQELKDLFTRIKITDLNISGNQNLIAISGKTNLFGAVVDVRIRGEKIDDTYAWSVRLAAPNNIELAKISPLFKPVNFTVNNGFFVLGGSDFDDLKWGGQVKKGVTFAGDFKVDGVLKTLLNAVGKSLHEVTLKGTLKQGWVGSSLNMRLGKAELGPGIETDEMYLGIAVGANKTPALAITTDIEIPLKPPLKMKAAISGDLTQGIAIKGELPGKFKLPEIPLEIEDLGIDSKLGAGATLGFKAKTNLGSKVVDLVVCMSPPILLGRGEFKGGLSLEDIIKLTSDVISLAVGKKIDLVGAMKNAIPNIKLDNALLKFSPRPLECVGRPLQAGIEVDTTGNILGKLVAFSAKVGQDGLKMKGFLEKLSLGPLVISGYKGDKGAEVEVLATTTGDFRAYIDGKLGLNLGPLGTSSINTHIDLKPSSAVFDIKTDLFSKLFLVQINGNIALANPLDSYGVFLFEQTALNKISDSLKSASKDILKARDNILRTRTSVHAELERVRKNTQKILQQAKLDAEKELQVAKNKLKALEQERNTAKGKFESARADLQNLKGKFDSANRDLQKAKDSINWSLKANLDRASAECKRKSFPADFIPCRERDGLAIAWAASEGAKFLAKGGISVAQAAVEAAKGPFSAAQGILTAAEETYKGLLVAVQEASKGVLNASNVLQKASVDLANLAQSGAMETAKGVSYAGLTTAGLTTEAAKAVVDLTAEAIAKGFNIQMIKFEAKFADLLAGKLPRASIKGVVFGQSFDFSVQADFSDIGKLADSIINKVFGG